jgi:hypothetical protein
MITGIAKPAPESNQSMLLGVLGLARFGRDNSIHGGVYGPTFRK